jgi:hypothetical protein
MKRVLSLVIMVIALSAKAQVQMPGSSPNATLTTVVGLTEVKIEYSRPKAKGRKIFGAGNEFLTPYGHMWRTGANNGTIVTFGDDVKFGGAAVAKGSYKLFTIPGATDWTVILSKDMNLGGNDPEGYKTENDAARVTVKSEKLTERVETFTIEISDLSADSKTANLQIMWENTSVKVPINVDFDAKVMASIKASTKVDPGNLYQAAGYYLDTNKDLRQALEWITTAAAAQPDAYWVMYRKAQIQQALGDKKGAMESPMKSKAVAEKEKNMDYVKMNDEVIKATK